MKLAKFFSAILLTVLFFSCNKNDESYYQPPVATQATVMKASGNETAINNHVNQRRFI